MTAKHLIGKQCFELRLAGTQAAHEIQQEVSVLCWERMTPAFEKLFDRLTPDDRLIRIGKLELDLGTISRRELSSDAFSAMLVRVLETAIADATRGSPDAIVQPLSVGRFELWLYFLEHGHLPVSAVAPESRVRWREQIFSALSIDPKAGQRLRQLLSTRPAAMERLVMQHDGIFLRQLVAWFTGRGHLELPNVVGETAVSLAQVAHRLVAGPGGEREPPILTIGDLANGLLEVLSGKILAQKSGDVCIMVLRKQLFQALETEMISGRPLSGRLAQPDFWRVVLTGIVVPEELEAASHQVAGVFSSQRGTGSPTQIRQWETCLWRLVLREALIQAPKASSRELLSRALRRGLAEAGQRGAANKTPPLPVKPLAKSPSKHGFYILNAGVILLHPFLPHLFEKFALGIDQLFKDEWHRQKAVCLLHHLATGESQAPEYELVLPKLLCGMPLETPLDHSIGVSEEERLESDGLLQAAIEHWGALGGSSPAALREGFLQRAGKLEKRESGWHLQMEHKTLDVLLDRLPWGIGVVKLTWMPELLRVEWRC